ncbi:hypothetical protein ACFSRY_01230 [Pontibacter locisalis]|uniref:Uncharacterized protein n=1 Tax=Pontibacter locisalis TaxID=1719035 RepID=A0ABW5IGF6_9BACT
MEKQHAAGIQDILRVSSLVLVVGFLLNLIWENAQAPLYEGYKGFYGHFWLCFVAAVVDALVILLLYLLFLVYSQHLYWPLAAGFWQRLLLVIAGVLLAVWFEKWALNVEQWGYAEAMPIIPILDIGLLPVLQLMFLPFATFWVSMHVARANLAR